MATRLSVSLGQFSDKGRKALNQDFHGVYLPKEPQLSAKGIALALADGISSSDVSQIASETAVKGFLEDYFCTSDAWSVKKSAQRVLVATNAWLHAQTQRSQYRFDRDRGYVCTFSALVLKACTAYLFHVGDTRIYRWRAGQLEQLTQDHRIWIAQDKSYLGRALGIDSQLEIDYQALPVEPGDIFLLATDGVYEHASDAFIGATLDALGDDLDGAARRIVMQAYDQGSSDNLTLQILRVDSLPAVQVDELHRQVQALPLPPPLDARKLIDGYRILRTLHASSRSHVYLALDEASGQTLVLKTPSIDRQDDAAYLERFLAEEWIARRLDSAHVLKALPLTRQRSYLYSVSEYIEGQTLSQWMVDHPHPELETVRAMVEQIARGLQAFHRLEMLHQDLRPDNILIDRNGTLKIIDFGSTRVAGLVEMAGSSADCELLGTAQYSAPEYFLGESGTPRSDYFSLGVIAYQMLSGQLPYGAEVARTRTQAAQQRLDYQPLRDARRALPAWIDDVLKKAVHVNPLKRYGELSEFVFELRQPNQAFLNKTRAPLLERNPLLFWKGLCVVLAAVIVVLLAR
ncbi:MAG: bifunctional protein-serine/threonine kinase/phosphatase [Pseudomonas sp.]|uniref:protein kinase domain-containing protein n=1 Tax=Pseudomonas sp. TaxID=306 RepID=UPI0033982CCE